MSTADNNRPTSFVDVQSIYEKAVQQLDNNRSDCYRLYVDRNQAGNNGARPDACGRTLGEFVEDIEEFPKSWRKDDDPCSATSDNQLADAVCVSIITVDGAIASGKSTLVGPIGAIDAASAFTDNGELEYKHYMPAPATNPGLASPHYGAIIGFKEMVAEEVEESAASTSIHDDLIAFYNRLATEKEIWDELIHSEKVQRSSALIDMFMALQEKCMAILLEWQKDRLLDIMEVAVRYTHWKKSTPEYLRSAGGAPKSEDGTSPIAIVLERDLMSSMDFLITGYWYLTENFPGWNVKRCDFAARCRELMRHYIPLYIGLHLSFEKTMKRMGVESIGYLRGVADTRGSWGYYFTQRVRKAEARGQRYMEPPRDYAEIIRDYMKTRLARFSMEWNLEKSEAENWKRFDLTAIPRTYLTGVLTGLNDQSPERMISPDGDVGLFRIRRFIASLGESLTARPVK